METNTIRITKIEVVANEDVYDISVENNHNFFANGILVHNCVEIGMWPALEYEDGSSESGWEFCNLTEVNMKKAKTVEAYLEAVKAAAILGTIQAGYTDFPYLGNVTEQIVRNEALLGVSMTGMMDTPEIAFDPEIQKAGAKEALKWNSIVSKLLNINECARATCVKPSGTASCVLGTANGCHPHHAKRYFRLAQANKMEFPVQHFMKYNTNAVEESVWSANQTDYVITFLCEVPDGAKVKNNLDAVELLQHVKLTQDNWVQFGTRKDKCTKPFLRHNVSNTITVRPDEWDNVRDFIYNNKQSFAGISLLPTSGDKDYNQAPFTAVYTPSELVKMYGDAAVFASGLIVDGVHAFDSLWRACDCALDIGEMITASDLRKRIINDYSIGMSWPELTPESDDNQLQAYLDNTVAKLNDKIDWIRRVEQFADRYFDGNIKNVTYCLKDVSNWKKWVDLNREYVDIDWSQAVEDSYRVKADEISSSACVGGTCDLFA